MPFHLSVPYNDEDEATVDTPNIEKEPEYSSIAMNKDVTRVKLTKQILYVEEFDCPNKFLKRIEDGNTELLTELEYLERPVTVEALNGAMKKVAARKRKAQRGSRVYKCPFCDYKCTPGGRANMMNHLNGFKKGDKFRKPCKERMKAKPASKNGVFEKLEPIDVTDKERENLYSGNSSSQE